MDKRIIFLLGLMICVLLPAVTVRPSANADFFAQITKNSVQDAGSSQSSPVIVGFADTTR